MFVLLLRLRTATSLHHVLQGHDHRPRGLLHLEAVQVCERQSKYFKTVNKGFLKIKWRDKYMQSVNVNRENLKRKADSETEGRIYGVKEKVSYRDTSHLIINFI